MSYDTHQLQAVLMSVVAVAQKLGGRKVIGRELRTEADLIAAVREGFPARSLEMVFEDLADLELSQAQLYATVGNIRTLLRKRAKKQRLSTDESDRLARVARMLVRAEDAFGDQGNAHRWLARPNRALGSHRPFQLLDSDAGSQLVEQVLGRIEHGVFS